MQMHSFIAAMRVCFKQWFHQRNIIIVSERKVKHVPISGGMQFAVLSVFVAAFLWASYSTGSYLAARGALKSQAHALRSIANARIENNFSLYPPVAGSEEPATLSLSNPMATLPAMDQNKLFARVAFLEQRVTDLQNTNASIIQRVREKTSGRIDDLESIIKQTGLNPESLKKDAIEKKAVKEKATGNEAQAEKAQGGPYIPANSFEDAWEKELYSDLDELSALRKIVGNLPLASPIENASDQSTFGHRIDPFTGHLAFHSGLDMAGPAGSRIYATADGKVALAARDGAYGNAVEIKHGFGVSTRYAHLSEILVKQGQTVSKGDVVGIQGSTGRSTGNHLHYEVRYRDQPMNPRNFLKAGSHVSEE